VEFWSPQLDRAKLFSLDEKKSFLLWFFLDVGKENTLIQVSNTNQKKREERRRERMHAHKGVNEEGKEEKGKGIEKKACKSKESAIVSQPEGNESPKGAGDRQTESHAC